jgi:hypothetical protein
MTGVPAITKYIGRGSEISRLQELLLSNGPDRRKVVVIHGLGGVGKTQLAIEFARKHRDSYTAIFWLEGKSQEILVRSIASIIKRIPGAQQPTPTLKEVKGDEDVKKQAEEALAWLALERNSNWLLIYDNIDQDTLWCSNVEDEDSFNVESFFPRTDKGSIIITTRLRRLRDLGSPLPLGVLNREDAMAVLAESAGRTLLQNDSASWCPGERASATALVSYFH